MNKNITDKFEDILDSLYLFTARPSSIQRESFYGGHVTNNRFHSIKYLLNMPVSETDVEWYFDKQGAELFLAEEAEEFFKPGFYKEYKRRSEEYFETWFELCREMKDHFSDPAKHSSEKTLDLIKKYYAYPFKDDTAFYFGLSVWSFEQKVVPEFEKILKTFFGNNYDSFWQIITAPTQLSDEQKFRIELANLKREYGDDLPDSVLQSTYQKYRYLGIYSPEDYGLDEHYILKAYRDLNVEQALSITDELAENEKSLEVLRQSCKDKRILEIIDLINFNINFRNQRSEKLSHGFSMLTPFYDYLMDKTGLNRMQVGNVTRDEVVDFFEHGSPLPKRIGHPGMLYSGKISHELTSAEKELFIKKFRSFMAVDEIAGTTAHSGVAKGKVKVIQSMNELEKVEQGDVLVSQFTRPEFMAAIKKAIAIVTNDGGITCHAAIVSRELNKPCIIGTKIATKVLHDGDEVEVDADKGIVRIITKK